MAFFLSNTAIGFARLTRPIGTYCAYILLLDDAEGVLMMIPLCNYITQHLTLHVHIEMESPVVSTIFRATGKSFRSDAITCLYDVVK